MQLEWEVVVVAVVVEVIVSSSDNEKNNACVHSSAEKPEIQFSVANSKFRYLVRLLFLIFLSTY